jgi:hypothetical protein
VIVLPAVQKLRDKWRAAKPQQAADRNERGESPLYSRLRLAHVPKLSTFQVPQPVNKKSQSVVKPSKNSLNNFNSLPNTVLNNPEASSANQSSKNKKIKVNKNVQQQTTTRISQPLNPICIPIHSVQLPTLQKLFEPWNSSPEKEKTKSNALQFNYVKIRPLAIDYPTFLWPATDDEVLFLCRQDGNTFGGIDEVD